MQKKIDEKDKREKVLFPRKSMQLVVVSYCSPCSSCIFADFFEHSHIYVLFTPCKYFFFFGFYIKWTADLQRYFSFDVQFVQVFFFTFFDRAKLLRIRKSGWLWWSYMNVCLMLYVQKEYYRNNEFVVHGRFIDKRKLTIITDNICGLGCDMLVWLMAVCHRTHALTRSPIDVIIHLCRTVVTAKVNSSGYWHKIKIMAYDRARVDSLPFDRGQSRLSFFGMETNEADIQHSKIISKSFPIGGILKIFWRQWSIRSESELIPANLATEMIHMPSVPEYSIFL